MVTCANTGRVVSAETKKRKRTDGTEYEITYLGAWLKDNLKKKVYVKEDLLLQ